MGSVIVARVKGLFSMKLTWLGAAQYVTSMGHQAVTIKTELMKCKPNKKS